MSHPCHLPSPSTLTSLLSSPVGQSVPLPQLFTQRWCLTPCYSECGLQASISGIICVGKKCRLSGHPQTERIKAFILTRSPCDSNPCEILRSVDLVPVSQMPKKLASVEYFLGLGVFPSLSHSQFSSVQSLSRVRLFATPRTAAHQASLCITNSRSSLRLTSISSLMPSNHLILCHPLLLQPSNFPSIRVFSNEPVLHIRWPKYWSFSVSISPSNEYSGAATSS